VNNKLHDEEISNLALSFTVFASFSNCI